MIEFWNNLPAYCIDNLMIYTSMKGESFGYKTRKYLHSINRKLCFYILIIITDQKEKVEEIKISF